MNPALHEEQVVCEPAAQVRHPTISQAADIEEKYIKYKMKKIVEVRVVMPCNLYFLLIF